ncbi:MAG: GAF domain-containing protein [Candidatus Dadabacteria bacterium]|nr:MAG: GAF domain-containing protein [Candidatus Dadabacteria bacterium]
MESLKLDRGRLEYLARLPLLLTSSLDVRRVTQVALKHVRDQLKAAASTVYLYETGSGEIQFWALGAGEDSNLQGKKMPAGRGVVGWVIENRKAALVNDTENDPRFFSEIDNELGHKTRNLLCVPLFARGERVIGAVQVLNKQDGDNFNEEDLRFLEQFAAQLGLAVENARLYQALEEKTRQLTVLEKRKNEMITVIGHEFKTPFNIIQTAAQMLVPGLLKDEATREKMLDTIMNGVDRLSRLISEIDNIRYVTAGELQVALAECNLKDIFNELEAVFKQPLQTRSQKLTTAVMEGAGMVRADRALLMVVLTNLLSNAIRFTPDGGQISISAKRSAGMVEIAVRDNGIGIPEDQHALIFEKFYEVGEALQHSSGTYEFKSGGLGLGLATVKAILKAHGSSIELESSEDSGSTFTFRLPAEE